ncbi:hypothetical protein D1872_194430 [compost metagenome]
MKKSIPLLHVLDHLVTEEDIQEILQTHGYKDTARKLSVSLLLRFLIMAATHEWKSFRHAAVDGDRPDLAPPIQVLSSSVYPCANRQSFVYTGP